MKTGRITIKDLARELNVSIGTIDRALNNKAGIKEDTRLRVIAKAVELGYEVNSFASSLSRKGTYKIGVVFPQTTSEFFNHVAKGVKAAEEKLKNYKIEVLMRNTAELNPQMEIAILNNLKENDIDGLVVCPYHTDKLNTIINEFVDKGIPVVTIATDAPESKRLTCICTEPYKNGEIAADLLTNFIGNQGKVAVISGYPDIEDHSGKVRGFKSMIASNAPNVEVADVLYTYMSEEEAYKVTLNILKNVPEIKGLYTNHSSCIGVCRAIEELGMEGIVKLVTTDLFSDTRVYIKKGVIQATIYQAPYLQGYNSIYCLFDNLVMGKKMKRFNYIKPEIVLYSCLDFYP